MQKFPLRMKDNDLLVTELYKDQSNDHITAISVYLTPKITSKSRLGNWQYSWSISNQSKPKLISSQITLLTLQKAAAECRPVKFAQLNY